MLVTWICRNCHEPMGSLNARDDDPRVLSLTSQVDGDIIDYNQGGTLVVRLLCDDCLEESNMGESESSIIRPTQLH